MTVAPIYGKIYSFCFYKIVFYWNRLLFPFLLFYWLPVYWWEAIVALNEHKFFLPSEWGWTFQDGFDVIYHSSLLQLIFFEIFDFFKAFGSLLHFADRTKTCVFQKLIDCVMLESESWKHFNWKFFLYSVIKKKNLFRYWKSDIFKSVLLLLLLLYCLK